MNSIKMVDLQGQYLKVKDEIDNAIHQVIDSTAFINGPVVNQFGTSLSSYLGSKHVIPCANGTDALQVAMMALDLKPGDEVITSSFTFIATVEVIALLGLKPVFVDVDENTFNLNVSQLEKAINSNTKVILPVHLFGQGAEMESIMRIARKHNLYVIEDNCQAIGADYTFSNGDMKKLGSIGHIGCTSFFPSKNLGCYGDGGALFTDNDELADKIKIIVNHGMKVRYYHDMIGVNSRLDSIQAAILNVKLKYLDDYILARQNVADYYDNAFKTQSKLIIPGRSSFSSHVFHQYTLRLNGVNRQELQNYLNEKGIPSMIYYPVPIHLQKAFAGCNYHSGDLPITEKLSETVISLPMHTEMDEEQLNHITSSLIMFLNLRQK